MKLEDYADNIGSKYRISKAGEVEVSLTLVEAKALPSPPEDAPEQVRRDPFYLVFHGRISENQEAQILEMQGPSGELFLLSVNNEGPIEGAPKKGFQYYAVCS